jgi:hypothetical protein
LPQVALQGNPQMRPIRIGAGAFGPNTPARDTWVSPQHMILISGASSALMFGQDEILVPAKKLVNRMTICVDSALREVEYLHLLFDRHEIICADGLWSESFLPGPETDSVLPTHAEFLSIFGAVNIRDLAWQAAHMTISDRQTALLV